MQITFLFLDDFLLGNLYWIVAISILAIIIVYLLIDSRKAHKGKKKAPVINEGAYLAALGGKDNIVSKSLEGSRIVLTLKDYDAVNRDQLREAGVSGFVLMSNRLTLVIKTDAEEVYKRLFPNG